MVSSGGFSPRYTLTPIPCLEAYALYRSNPDLDPNPHPLEAYALYRRGALQLHSASLKDPNQERRAQVTWQSQRGKQPEWLVTGVVAMYVWPGMPYTPPSLWLVTGVVAMYV